MKRFFHKLLFVALLSVLVGLFSSPAQAQTDDPSPPDNLVKLIFIHHSVGENWLTDGDGNLGRTLGENNYFVSDTNYGWGPDSIGDATDYYNWYDWFLGPESGRYLDALYSESGQNSSDTRTLSDPGGENQIIIFKSCFPNSDLGGNPNEAAADGEWYTVGHAKYVYNQLLGYFNSRPDKLFIVITPPPLLDSTHAENAREFSRWLVEDWLIENDYPFNNVAVWDLHNTLTNPDNHHRFQDGAIEHTINHGNGILYYDSDGDEHPNSVGNQKATAEFVPMLNIFYNRWIASAPTSPPPQQDAQTQPEADEQTPAQEQPPVALAESGLVDDFESGAPAATNGWESFWDDANTATTLSCSVDSSVAQAGSSSLMIDFHIEPESWGTCALMYDSSPGFAGTRGLAFDYLAGAAALHFNVDAYGGSPDARSTYHYTLETVPESVEGWVHIELTWDQILRVDWEENPGTPVNPAEINGFAFGFDSYPDTPNSGTIWIDNFTVLGKEDTEDQSQPVEEVEPGELEDESETGAIDEDTGEVPSVAAEGESGRRVCPGAMALSILMAAGVGIIFIRKE